MGKRKAEGEKNKGKKGGRGNGRPSLKVIIKAPAQREGSPQGTHGNAVGGDAAVGKGEERERERERRFTRARNAPCEEKEQSGGLAKWERDMALAGTVPLQEIVKVCGMIFKAAKKSEVFEGKVEIDWNAVESEGKAKGVKLTKEELQSIWLVVNGGRLEYVNKEADYQRTWGKFDQTDVDVLSAKDPLALWFPSGECFEKDGSDVYLNKMELAQQSLNRDKLKDKLSWIGMSIPEEQRTVAAIAAAAAAATGDPIQSASLLHSILLQQTAAGLPSLSSSSLSSSSSANHNSAAASKMNFDGGERNV